MQELPDTPTTPQRGSNMKISCARCAYEPELFRHAFGFKGSTLSGVWQTVVALKSENEIGIGLGIQSVLWSDSSVFLEFGEKRGNELMFAVTEYAVKSIEGNVVTLEIASGVKIRIDKNSIYADAAATQQQAK